MKNVFVILILTFSTLKGYSQSLFQQPGEIIVKGKGGFVIPHRSYLNHMLQGHAYGIEIDYQIQTLGKMAWQRRFKLPQVGFMYTFYDFGNRELLGVGHALTPYIQFHFVKRPKFEMNFKTGLGMAYMTKKFDPIENPKNLAVSSRLLINIDLALVFKQIFGRFSIEETIGFSHYSNASIKTPNLGLNVPTIGIGLGYRLIDKPVSVDTQYYEISRKFSYTLIGIGSIKQVYPVGGKFYPVGALRFFAQKMIANKSGFGIGADFMFNSANFSYIQDYTIKAWDVFQVGIMAHYTLKLDRLEFQFGVGSYLKNKVNQNGWIYSRLGLQYIWDNGFLANLTLKTHYAKADYLEAGIGYRWQK